MSRYLDRIAAEAPADLIAAEARTIKDQLESRYGTSVWAHRTRNQARRNREHNEAVLEALRAVWRLANAGDPAWRLTLVDFIGQYEDVIGGGHNRLVRLRLIAECAPEITATATAE